MLSQTAPIPLSENRTKKEGSRYVMGVGVGDVAEVGQKKFTFHVSQMTLAQTDWPFSHHYQGRVAVHMTANKIKS